MRCNGSGNSSPDILLLDISMPGMDGMSLARVLQEGGVVAGRGVLHRLPGPGAQRAFEVEAVDYLVKPVRAERLEKALDKARRYLGQDDGSARTNSCARRWAARSC